MVAASAILALAALQQVWTPTSMESVPAPRWAHTAVWTGSEMIVWGGEYFGGYLGDGGRFDPRTNHWTALPSAGAPTARSYHTAVWTGREMVIWGGRNAGILGDGAKFDPVSNAWLPVTATAAPSPRCEHRAVWTGSLMIVWGGGPDQSGGRYDPAADTWTPTSLAGPPTTRSRQAQIWTGKEMIVWGNGVGGSLYDPTTDSWTAMPLIAGDGAQAPAAVWTGHEMLWFSSGPASIPYAGRYDPQLGTSSLLPDFRDFLYGSAVWSGREAIVIGASNATLACNRGSYNPLTNAWTELPEASSPQAGLFTSMVWTGREAIAWGGSPGGAIVVNEGAMLQSLDSLPRQIVAETGCLSTGRDHHSALLLGTLGVAVASAALLLARRRRGLSSTMAILALMATVSRSAGAQEADGLIPESSDWSARISAGIWANGFQFDAVIPQGAVTLDSGAMGLVQASLARTELKPMFYRMSAEVAFGDDATIATFGVDLGAVVPIWKRDALELEADVYVGAIYSRLDIETSDIDAFDPAIGFRAGLTARLKLPVGFDLDGSVEYRQLSYDWSADPLQGDTTAEASGVAAFLGATFRF